MRVPLGCAHSAEACALARPYRRPVERGDGIQASEMPSVARRDHEPLAHWVVRFALTDAVQRMAASLSSFLGTDDAESLHQARVATRRIRSDLRTFRPLLDRDWAEEVRDELEWLADDLGRVRDADVMLVRLRRALDRHPEIDRVAAERLLVEGEQERELARVSLLAHLGEHRAQRLFDVLVDATEPRMGGGAGDASRRELRALVRKPWRRLRRLAGTVGDEPTAAELHRIRITAKEVRYAADAVAPAFGRKARRAARSMAALQDALGELRDIATTRAWLSDTAVRLDSRSAYAAGRLCEVVAVGSSEDDWRARYRTARKRLRRWLD